jgi:hypothetical protein
LGDFTLPATHLLHIHNETNRRATDKFKSEVDANPTAAHKQHHHRPPHALHALDVMIIFLLASTSAQQSPWGVGMWEPPTVLQSSLFYCYDGYFSSCIISTPNRDKTHYIIANYLTTTL